MSRKKKVLYLCLFVAVYVILLVLIAKVEGNNPDASIHNVFDAFWYSITTITTVGYGDLFPVTAGGRLLGSIFVLLSLGFAGLIIGYFVSKFSGKIIPLVFIMFSGKENCYIFDGVSDHSMCLAKNISKQDSDGLVVLCGTSDTVSAGKKENGVIVAGMSVEELIRLTRGKKKRYVFSMGEGGFENYQRALSYEADNMEAYCETPFYVDGNPANVHIFNKYTCVASYLWRNYPLQSNDKNIVFIGCDNFGTAVIEQGLLVNVDKECGSRRFDIFGNSAQFRNLRPELNVCFGVDEKQDGKDTLYFHDEDPFANMELLQNADCIYLISDSDELNLDYYNKICRFIHGDFRVFVRECSGIDISRANTVFFGEDKDIYNYDMVIRDAQSASARKMHETYCKTNPDKSVPWDELTYFVRCSNMSVADHIPTKLRILLNDCETAVTPERIDRAREAYQATKDKECDMYRRIEHERWTRFHILNGWGYAPVRCDAKCKHNLIVPFDQLSKEEQSKDDYGWEIL